jgi:hypothetical protein
MRFRLVALELQSIDGCEFGLMSPLFTGQSGAAMQTSPAVDANTKSNERCEDALDLLRFILVNITLYQLRSLHTAEIDMSEEGLRRHFEVDDPFPVSMALKAEPKQTVTTLSSIGRTNNRDAAFTIVSFCVGCKAGTIKKAYYRYGKKLR